MLETRDLRKTTSSEGVKVPNHFLLQGLANSATSSLFILHMYPKMYLVFCLQLGL